jgi:hypothetical protein
VKGSTKSRTLSPKFVQLILDFYLKKTCYKIKRQSFWTPLIDFVKSCKGTHATKSKTGHLGHLGLTCETYKQIHATKSKTGIWDFGWNL